MTKVAKPVRNGGGRRSVALLAVGIVVGAYADGATSRIRHMADTYLQSDGTQIIDTGYIASTNMRVEVVFTPLERQYSTYTRYVWGSNASGDPAKLRCSTCIYCRSERLVVQPRPNESPSMRSNTSSVTGKLQKKASSPRSFNCAADNTLPAGQSIACA